MGNSVYPYLWQVQSHIQRLCLFKKCNIWQNKGKNFQTVTHNRCQQRFRPHVQAMPELVAEYYKYAKKPPSTVWSLVLSMTKKALQQASTLFFRSLQIAFCNEDHTDHGWKWQQECTRYFSPHISNTFQESHDIDIEKEGKTKEPLLTQVDTSSNMDREQYDGGKRFLCISKHEKAKYAMH